MRILIDMDNVLYDIDAAWLSLHNNDYPEHQITPEDYKEWDRKHLCESVGCGADIYGYLLDKRVWVNGTVIQNSQEITRRWIEQGHELAVVTAAGNSIAPNRKVSWLKEHFPHLDNIFIVSGRQKHWLMGDILIDDAIHNLEQFTGVSVLFDQPWNRNDNRYPRVMNWNQLDELIQRAEYLMQSHTFLYMKEYPMSVIQDVLLREGMMQYANNSR